MAKAKEKSKPQTFVWSGIDKGNRKASGELEAANIQVAKLLLRRQGIRVKKIKKRGKSLLSLGKSVKVKDIVFFTRQLATMIESGIPIATSLRGISMGHENDAMKKLISTVTGLLILGSAQLHAEGLTSVKYLSLDMARTAADAAPDNPRRADKWA